MAINIKALPPGVEEEFDRQCKAEGSNKTAVTAELIVRHVKGKTESKGQSEDLRTLLAEVIVCLLAAGWRIRSQDDAVKVAKVFLTGELRESL